PSPRVDPDPQLVKQAGLPLTPRSVDADHHRRVGARRTQRVVERLHKWIPGEGVASGWLVLQQDRRRAYIAVHRTAGAQWTVHCDRPQPDGAILPGRDEGGLCGWRYRPILPERDAD